jgi:hypothetical protein
MLAVFSGEEAVNHRVQQGFQKFYHSLIVTTPEKDG